MASPSTPAMIATTIVPWYWLADGVLIPARLQTSQMLSSGPDLAATLDAVAARAALDLLAHARSSRSPASMGTGSQFSCGASGQLQRGS